MPATPAQPVMPVLPTYITDLSEHARPGTNPADNDGLDVITLGRCSVDVYGEQRYVRLEDTTSFARYVGGCPANIAIGMARLGMRVGFITRVGEDQMGRYIREQMRREHVDVTGIQTDAERLTALAILAIRTDEEFPLLFYRHDCADMAINPALIDATWLTKASVLVTTGTHLSTAEMRAVTQHTTTLMRQAGRTVVFDIDYRPNLWGKASLEDGASRFVVAAEVTAILQQHAAQCDVIVGTEEEWHIAGGSTNTIEALRQMRAITPAILVVKRGAEGCSTFAGAIGDYLDDGITDRGPTITVFNVLGAGDGFMSGYLRGLFGEWAGDDPSSAAGDGENQGAASAPTSMPASAPGSMPTSLSAAQSPALDARIRRASLYGNACGALVVSRHGCAPATPSWSELTYFLARRHDAAAFSADGVLALHRDAALARLHRVSTAASTAPEPVGRADRKRMAILAFDHRAAFTTLSAKARVNSSAATNLSAIIEFKTMLAMRMTGVQVPSSVQPGVIIDDEMGLGAIQALSMLTTPMHPEPGGGASFLNSGLWIGRTIEQSLQTPLAFQGFGDVAINPASLLSQWPRHHTIKCLVFDDASLSATDRIIQDERLRQLSDAARLFGISLLIEVITSRHDGVHDPAHDLACIERYYGLGIVSDWWKLQAHADTATWQALTDLVDAHDPFCRGVLLLGLAADLSTLTTSVREAMQHEIVRGFAVGRTLWQEPVDLWFNGMLTLEECWQQIEEQYRLLVDAMPA
ncbi:MAG: 5-dehydro-2-deoxygluconokinase [Alphaproteobacteria bacterium]|nr:5-dehydro-2-deoxygluconokinase [Alphaproteobacteria bacterium]